MYAIAFLVRNFSGSGFELGVETLSGMSKAQLAAANPEILSYISHLHVAVSGFIAATAIAVIFLSWYGVRMGIFWTWVAAVVARVVGLAIALPLHYLNEFRYN